MNVNEMTRSQLMAKRLELTREIHANEHRTKTWLIQLKQIQNKLNPDLFPEKKPQAKTITKTEKKLTKILKTSIPTYSKKKPNCPNCKTVMKETEFAGTWVCPKCNRWIDHYTLQKIKESRVQSNTI